MESERIEYLIQSGLLTPEQADDPRMVIGADAMAKKLGMDPDYMDDSLPDTIRGNASEYLAAGANVKEAEDEYGTISLPENPRTASLGMMLGDVARANRGSVNEYLLPGEGAANYFSKAGFSGVDSLDLLDRLGLGLDMADALPGGAALGAMASIPARAARKGGAVEAAEGGLAKAEDLSLIPDVDQVPLDRYDPPRGRPKNLDSILTDETADRLEGYARAGMERGGPEWYNTEPLRKAFVEELGEDVGTDRFAKYMDIVAATSPRAKVDNNIRRASEIYRRDVQGEPYVGENLGKGYGHIAQKTHDHLLKDIAETGSFDAISRPKTSSFSQNLQGNQEPMTIDTHNMAAVMGDPKFKKSPTDTQYKYLEEFEGQIAEKLGLTPAQFQASVWVGADDITGVADSRPWLDVFDTVLERTAKRDGVSKTQALRDFIRGDNNLWQLAAAVGIGGGMAGGTSDAEAEESAGRLAPGAELVN